MKFTIVASLAAVVALVHAETCVYSTVSKDLQSLGQPIASCMTATGNSYNMARATAPPTEEEAAAICAKCPEFVSAVSKLTWPDCTMNVGGKNQTLTEYFDAMIGGCKEGSTTPAATTTASAATAEAGSHSGSTHGSGSTKADEVQTPSGSTPVPSSTKSAGYSLQVGVFAASAVATTIALAF